ncbi:TraR/DksA family transcriptional regulator [Streptomyces halobius]|uniref:TraR/DksA family transcriptional regulator n=1 Tax=Streptomyces halobius TaxID=2879846 RepID=A0ABY4MDZ0_9ACTN|nr:TraR/DksA C4-type zinc finger protein [Streptomyces halobius]UQA96006.1 TraR/DksA family transcriptional regulator [Streptomyces halobius]
MVAKETAAERSTTPADEADAKQPAQTTAQKKPAAKKTATKKAATKKTATKKAATKKTATKKAAAKKPAVKKAAAKKTATKTTAAKKAAKKAPAKKATGTVAASSDATKTGAKTVVAKKTTGAAGTHAKESAVPKARVSAAPDELAVRPGEEPWTPGEVAAARAELMADVERLRAEIATSEDAIAGLMRDGDGAGDDEADTGSKNITREHELALASNAREMLHQTERALGRLDAGTYGLCENCGRPIGKARMQAFPRATLCVECKQQQERH